MKHSLRFGILVLPYVHWHNCKMLKLLGVIDFLSMLQGACFRNSARYSLPVAISRIRNLMKKHNDESLYALITEIKGLKKKNLQHPLFNAGLLLKSYFV